MITVLETNSLVSSWRPPFERCRVNWPLGFCTVKVSVTVTGAPVPRT